MTQKAGFTHLVASICEIFHKWIIIQEPYFLNNKGKPKRCNVEITL